MKLVICVCLIIANLANSAKFPASFKKCDKKDPNFEECLPISIENAIAQLKEPKKEVGFPSLEPLEIPSLVIGAGSSAVTLTQNYKNVKIYGFTNLKCSKANMDFEKKKLHVVCFFPEIRLEADYDFNGNILLLPVYGKGPAVVTLGKLTGQITLNLDEYEKKAKKYYKVTQSEVSLDPDFVTYKLDNLFNGDKTLGDNINQVLNDNWQEIFTDLKKNYEAAFADIGSTLFNNIASRVSATELFGDE